jgi:hypothetical protein
VTAALRLELACPHIGLRVYSLDCEHGVTRGWYLPESGAPADGEGLILYLRAHGLTCDLRCETALLVRERLN